eukprot:CAMPEP_0171102764 /NCGR_PEP_ID=MMETSP0766_2-20121228/58544_1 /TAXON_ID=439317 /ORGANISM="Gambierdiscus australes, Strain CAWD 149" /LENGTH=73 /DNA_ID=CAMNT_0011563119 /DNA_START=74 /DNA_END=292 /DNA_ORIENTATION=-
MIALVLLGLCLVPPLEATPGATGASAPCAGGDSQQACAAPARPDGGVHLLQLANVNSRMQPPGGSEEEEGEEE